MQLWSVFQQTHLLVNNDGVTSYEVITQYTKKKKRKNGKQEDHSDT